jgi:SAM-dependent methyltransferase
LKEYAYQLNFSNQHKVLYDKNRREQKAKKVLAVLQDYFDGNLANMSLLDLGCSTGVTANFLSPYFNKTIGIDIDEEAVIFAKETFAHERLTFLTGDSMNISFPDNSFDVIICAQVYEHVPDAGRLMIEIYRLLKPNGVCYFAAGNRIVFIEEHYNLPFLSIIPKHLAHYYLRILKRGDYYYENHLSFWGLKRLTAQFEIIDYTRKIIADPEKYYATDVLKKGSIKQKIALMLVKTLYWLSTDYIWLLKKC